MPESFRRTIAEYNEWYAERQCRNILQCLAVIDRERQVTHEDSDKEVAGAEGAGDAVDVRESEGDYEALFETRGTEPPSLSYKVLSQRFPDLVRTQVRAAIGWCIKYGVPLNRHNVHARRRSPGHPHC